ncbi:unnamed protein product [Brachionus calyciflorus]|uniref:SH2 domain-containing protein n=1 Tax=Brachionus calyciflorus TaxID=104777 RepID=A0A813PR78_9BILA|nr:unnamed protein product [Brachionus calyciflorus]
MSESNQKYIQMSNLTSGSSTRGSFRSNLRTSDLKFDQTEPTNPVYNFPWDVKLKQNPLLSQLNQSLPPPLPSVPPPSTSKILDSEPQDETQYCAPWDLKIQEEMLKLMTQQKTGSSLKKSNSDLNKNESNFKRNESNSSSFRNKTVTSQIEPSETEGSEYSPPWEHKQNLIFQQLANSNNKNSNVQMPAPLATSSASSTLANSQTNANAIGSLFNKLSLTRLSTRSNTSSSSSTRSSTSSLSTNSPPSMPPPSLPPPLLPPPPPPPPSSTVPTNQQSPLLSHRILNHQNLVQSNYLNDNNKNNSKFQPNTSTTTTNNTHHASSLFDTMGSNSSSSAFDDTKQILRTNRGGSNHHFSYPHPTQFQTISTGEIQVSALPVTALVFSQTNSLPQGILPINVQHQSQMVTQMPSPNRMNDLERHPWFHGRITRKHAEIMLNNKPIGSFLVRQSESGNSNDYSLSLVSGSGCVHMRICMKNGEFILGQCSQPFTSIVKMIDHYGRVEVPIKGAQHVKLSVPVAPSG